MQNLILGDLSFCLTIIAPLQLFPVVWSLRGKAVNIFVTTLVFTLHGNSDVASPKIWGWPKHLGGDKMYDFRRITLFCLEKRL